jgi:hypothetical protein
MSTTAHDQITVRIHEERAECEVLDFSMVGLVIAGLAATLAALAVLYAGPVLGLPRIDAVRLAGTMFTGDYLPGIVTGAALWTGIGMLFAVLYVVLWTHGVGRRGLRSGLLFGLIHGNLVMLLFPLFVASHPLGSEVPQTIGAGVSLVLAHVVFGAVMSLIYPQFLEPQGCD